MLNLDIYNNLPQELKLHPNWLGFRLERNEKSHRYAKIPYNPITGYPASTTDPQTWGTFAQAIEGLQKYHFSGIGYAFDKKHRIVAIDLDKCLD